MTFLPIVARELRVASRRRATYWMRAAAAFAIIVVGTWFFLMMQDRPPQVIAQFLFGLLTGSAVVYCLLSGIRSTADCLSEEKREGTLGLLFLTDLKGYDVVFGKLAATSLNAFYGVLAILPMLAVPLLMGGVTLGEFGRTALVAINALFFSLAMGMGMSALCRSGRRAMGITSALILCFVAVLPGFGAWLAYLGKASKVANCWLIPSAGYAYYLAFDTPYKLNQEGFWWSMSVIHVLAWLFLGLASLAAPRTWQDRPAGVRAMRWRERWHLWSYGDSTERGAFRRRLLDQNAFFWLAARARLKPACVWAVLGVLACVWAWGVAKFRHDWLNEGMYLTTGLVLNALLKLWFASEAGRQLAEDRHHGALELLLSTPLSVRDILLGQFLALQRQFLGPVVTVMLADLIFMLATLSEAVVDTDHAFWISLWTGGILMLMADLAALYWVGLWQALVAKNPNRAVSATIARILVLPWGTMALAILILSLSTNTMSDASWKLFLGMWFAIGLATDLFFGSQARHKLLGEFRRAAERRFSGGVGLWKGSVTERSANKADLPVVVGAQK